MTPLSSGFHEWECCVDNAGNSVACDVSGAAVTLGCLGPVFLNLVSALLLFFGLVAVVMFIFGGYKMINSGGDPKKLDSAKHNFTWGLLGLAVVVFAFLIINIIAWVTGVDCIRRFGFNCQ